jgi:riboflavin synthase
VDTAILINSMQKDESGSIVMTFKVPEPESKTDYLDYLTYIVAKGYVCLNGVSLTVVKVDRIQRTFQVMLIPYTQQQVNLPQFTVGDWVNLEVDQNGKYLESICASLLKDETKALEMMPWLSGWIQKMVQ